MKTFKTWTLGCKVNQYETEALEKSLVEAGYIKSKDSFGADVVLINTCTVTNMSDRKSRQIIRRAKRSNPESVVVVAGCYSQISPDQVSDIEDVDIIMGTSGREKLIDHINQVKMDKVKIMAVRDHDQNQVFENLTIEDTEERTRAYMKVQDGCNQYCSYCIIPYARGFIRSRSLDESIKEATRLRDKGFKEIILTGIHIGSYGKDLEEDIGLIDLIEEIAKIEGIERIRLSSIEPMTITEEFLERGLACGKLMDHFHLSLQSGSNKILKEMNRNYTCDEYMETVNRIRKYMPYAGITTDIIVGFPGETEEDFLESLDFVSKVSFSRIHVFPYSMREGTPAANREDQIDSAIKHDRSQRLIQLGESMAQDFIRKNLGRKLSVLFETKVEGRTYGYSSNYLRIYVKAERDLQNSLACVKIESVEQEPIPCKLVKELD